MAIPAVGSRHEEGISFSQDDFDAFARLSGDGNPIHVDPEFAQRTLFGRTVAHGMMLFGALSAAVARWLEVPGTIHTQELMFPAPTFAGPEYRLHLEVRQRDPAGFRIGQTIVGDDGIATAVGERIAWSGRTSTDPGITPARPLSGPDGYKGFHLGMTARSTRRFRSADVAAFCSLVDEPDPRYTENGFVPPALLGGAVSHLLGVELPGAGAHWLKQRYEFLRPVPLEQQVETEVEIVRFRPEKHLIDLSVGCSVQGIPVVTGRSLVHAQDVEPR